MGEERRDRADPPAGLYLHIPFCSAICPYCDFAVVRGGAAQRRAFVDSLRAEIGLYAGRHFGIDTIYFGGGTPSALDPRDLGSLVSDIHEALPGGAAAPIFMEANPEDVSAEMVSLWRAVGVTTLSLGVQSFDRKELRFLGRRHDPCAAREAIEVAQSAGFRTVSIDLIYGLPDQDPDRWAKTLKVATSLDLDHLSCYQLSVHEGTPFGRKRERGKLVELPEAEQGRLFEQTHQTLAESGLEPYEVSNFARAPEHRSRHNQKYWRHRPYLGLGPSAHSFAGRERWWNHRELGRYQESLSRQRAPVSGRERLTDQQLALEALMLGLRTTEGVDLGEFQERFHIDLKARNQSTLERLEERGLIRSVERRLSLTVRGLAIADAISGMLEVKRSG